MTLAAGKLIKFLPPIPDHKPRYDDEALSWPIVAPRAVRLHSFGIDLEHVAIVFRRPNRSCCERRSFKIGYVFSLFKFRR